MDITSDIVVIGAGPAGLALAAHLAHTDLKVTLLERSSETTLAQPAFDGRDIALTHASQETLSKLGIWDRIAETHKYPLREAKVQNGHSTQLLHFPMPTTARGHTTDRLGFLVSNHHIRQASYEQVKTLEQVEIICEAEVADVYTDHQGVQATLVDGRRVTGQLLVLADSRFSKTRAKMGFPVDMHQFGRTVMVFRVTHELSNECTAVEMFHYGHTMALLPLGDYMSNIVLTVDTGLFAQYKNMSDEALERFVEQETQGRLGTVKIAPDGRYDYPLVGTHARYFNGLRCALIGDAAVGMHPVTAHGYNLGVDSARILSELIIQAHQMGQSIASHALLAQYNRQHQFKTRPLYHGTNLIVKLFTQESPLAHIAREGVIRVSRYLPPVKHIITKQLTG